MTAHQDDATTPASRPARGRLSRAAVAPSSPVTAEAAEVAQGQAAAVLGALARMQLRLDVLAREQSDMFARLLARLDRLEDALHEQEPSPSSGADAPSNPWLGDLTAPIDAPPIGGEPTRSWQDSGS